MYEILNGDVNLSQIREVKVEDLSRLSIKKVRQSSWLLDLVMYWVVMVV